MKISGRAYFMKERIKKMTNFSAAMAIILALTSCGGVKVEDTISDNIAADTSVSAVTEVKKPEYDKEDYYCEWTADNAITLNGDTISVSGNGVGADKNTAEITEAGTYVVSGTLNDGQLIVNADKEDMVRIVLNGANIKSSSTSPVYVKQAEKVIITLADGTENTVSDGSEYVFETESETEPDSAIFSKDDLVFNGNGTLVINSNYNDALKSKDDLVIMSGTFNITSADDGIVGKDSLIIKDGTFNINAESDGLKTTSTKENKGELTVENGVFNITSGNDGIQSESTVYLIDGEYNIKTGNGGSTVSYDKNAHQPPEMPNGAQGGNMGTPPEMLNGERPKREQRGDRGGTPPEMQTAQNAAQEQTESIKGIKAENNIVIDGGTFNISAEDDAIHSNNSASVKNGTFEIATGDDAIHAENIINISGGNINVTNSYEGIEAAQINISGGNIRISASDDGLNASDGNGETMQRVENCFINITGGYMYVEADGDGVDSNGDVNMSGGTVIVDGPASGGDSAIDCNGSYYANGGILIAAGSSGMAENICTDSQQAGFMVTLPSAQQAGTAVNVTDANGNEIVTFAPSKTYQSVVISTPDIKQGESYTVYYGGSHSGAVADGVYSSGSYSPGEKLTEFTLESAVMNVTSQGASQSRGEMGGGMPGPMGGGHGRR